MPFLSDQKDWRATGPIPCPFFPKKLSDQHLDIAFLFSIVERSDNYVFWREMNSLCPWGRPVSYEIPIVYLYNMLSKSIETFFLGGREDKYPLLFSPLFPFLCLTIDYVFI